MTKVSNQNIQQNQYIQKTSTAVGKLGNHSIKLADGPEINLKSIKSAKVPFAGFKKATKIQRADVGIQTSGNFALKTLTRPSGKLNVQDLLSSLKAMQIHLERELSLGVINKAQIDDRIMAIFAPAVEKLSNSELASVYQSFTSGEMSLLQEGLTREISNNPRNKDAKSIASNLFDLEALVLKEVSNRVAVGSNIPGADSLPTLTETYAGVQVDNYNHEHDISSSNLKILVETAAKSATTAEKTVDSVTQDLRAKGIQGIDPRQMGDILRSSELTMNVNLAFLIGDDSPLDRSDKPWENAFHLAEKSEFFNPIYMDRRDAVEKTLFPEFDGHKVNPNERPTYAALNPLKRLDGGANMYGQATFVFKPEVAQRATYSIDDTFYVIKLTPTAQKISEFYALVPGLINLSKEIRPEFLYDLQKPESQSHKAFDGFLEKMARNPEFSTRNLNESFAGLLNCNTEESLALEALMIKVFANKEKTQANIASFDNIESLLPKLNELAGKDLAFAAMRKQSGLDSRVALDCTSYIEAQIQGPMVLDRDIDSIRISKEDFEALKDEQQEKLLNWAAQRDISVSIFDFDDTEFSDMTEEVNLIVEQQKIFNAEHLNVAEVESQAEEIISSDDKFTEFINKRMELGQVLQSVKYRSVSLGDDCPLQGAAFRRAKTKFYNEVQNVLRDPVKNDAKYTEEALKVAFDKSVLPMIESKLDLLKELEDLSFVNTDAKTSFRTWVLSSGALKHPQEMRLIHDRATAQCEAFKELVASSADPKTVIERFIEEGKKTDGSIAQFYADIGFADHGADDELSELDRICSISTSYLKAEDPALLQKSLDLLSSPALIQFDALNRSLTDPMDGIVENNNDFGSISIIKNLQQFNINYLRSDLGLQPLELQKDPRSFNEITQDERVFLHQYFPQMVAALDTHFPASDPIVLAPFPKAQTPDALPQDHQGRREFLLQTLPFYLEHENTFDKEMAVHGRNHIVRSFIFATAMVNKFAELNVPIDANAVLCGISGHDIGREGNGTDIWEKQSAEKTCKLMRDLYGANSMGSAYEGAVIAQIEGHAGRTLEALTLQAADSLDIGRTKDFSLSRFPFLREDLHVGDIVIHRDEDLRMELAKEANLLQRLTNPLVAIRDLYQELTIEAMMAESEAETNRKNDLAKDIKKGASDHFEFQRDISNADYLRSMEDLIRNNENLFPFLHKYYH